MQKSEAWRDLDQRLRAMQDLLRGSGASDPNLPLALFALQFLASKELRHSQSHISQMQEMQRLVSEVEREIGWDDQPFSEHLLADLKRLDSKALHGLLAQVHNIAPDNDLQAWLLEQTYALHWGGGHDTPRELARLMASLPRFDGPVRVFDPSCKSGNLLIAAREQLNTHSELLGQESDRNICAWAKVRLAISHTSNTKVELATSREPSPVDNSVRYGRYFDVVLSNPPFGVQFQLDKLEWLVSTTQFKGGRMPSELAYLMSAYHHLAEAGVAAILVPLGVLFRTGMDSSVRKALLDENAVDAVIALPARLSAPATAIETAIMVLRRATPDKSDVGTLLIDARQLGVRHGQKVVLDEAATGKILDVYQHRTVEPGFSTVAETSDIIAQDFNLSPSRYVEQLPTATVDVSARREHIATLDRHSQQLLDEYEVLIEALMLDARQHQ